MPKAASSTSSSRRVCAQTCSGPRSRRGPMRRERAKGVPAEVESFLAFAAVERGLAPRTLEAYARDLRRFAEHLERRGVAALAQARREHVTGFLASLERQGLAARSRARTLVAVRRLLRHAGVAGGDASADVSLPRFEQRLPRVLRPDETARLLEVADASTPLGLRDRA